MQRVVEAPMTSPEIKRADGEQDGDKRMKKTSLDDVLNELLLLPERARKLLLVSLFGTVVGAIMDILLGSPIGLTSLILRGILKLVPGGWIILGALDGLGYLLAKTKDVFRITHDPGFKAMAQHIQHHLPADAASKLTKAAYEQIGALNIGSSIVALLHAIYLRLR